MISQQTFMGLSIGSFTTSLGFGTQPSSLQCTLYEDPKNGDAPAFVAVGQPTVFNYSGWVFRGILARWTYDKSESGFVYNVTLEDPRQVLDGYQLILEDIVQSLSAPNYANIYGYLENIAFGNSNRNDTGIKYQDILNTINTIQAGGTGYGGNVVLRGAQYVVNHASLLSMGLDADYRVGDNISYLDLISELCEAASHDFFITLEPGNIVKINTINRSVQPVPGALTSYINSQTNIINSSSGVEFRNEITSKVLFGGRQIRMFGVNTPGASNIEPDRIVWPFWSFQSNLDLVIGTGLNDDHIFELDSRSVEVPGVKETYPTDVPEMRAALAGKDSWEDFLKFKDAEPGQHLNKATEIKIIGFAAKKPNFKASVSQNLATGKKEVINSSEAIADDHEEALNRLYSFVLGFARDYYGKRFIVSIPDIDAAEEPDTGKIRLSLEPDEAGYIDESELPNAISNNLLPQDFVRLANDDGRYPPYVRYDGVANLDFSEVPDEDIVFNDTKTSAFIRGTVEDGVAFEDVAGISGPRVVVSINGAVRNRELEKNTDVGGTIRGRVEDDVDNNIVTDEEKDVFLNNFGIDNIYTGKAGLNVLPNFVAVPLRKKENYGPWVKAGGNGKLQYEHDPSLVPWEYGNFTNLDIIGNAKVNQASSNMVEIETGHIEFPGAPAYVPGFPINPGLPVITDIDVQVSENGVTTVYKFSTYSPKFGRLQKQVINKFARLSKDNARLKRRAFERINKTSDLTNVEREVRKLKDTKRKTGNTSHGILSGEGILDSGTIYPNVFIQPHYNFTSQLGKNYDKKAGMSMDGMFRPFTTNPEASSINIPYFETPVSGAQIPTAEELNPFKSGHDISVALRGSGLPEDLTLANNPYFGSDWRGMALRGPLVLAGWGYDTEGKPVPNESGGEGQTKTDVFKSGYLNNMQNWKVGPVDLPWDEERKVWVGGGGSAKFVRITTPSGESFPCGIKKVYYAEVMGHTFSETLGSNVSISGKNEFMYVGNFRNNVVLESSVYLAYKVAGKYYLDNQTTFSELG